MTTCMGHSVIALSLWRPLDRLPLCRLTPAWMYLVWHRYPVRHPSIRLGLRVIAQISKPHSLRRARGIQYLVDFDDHRVRFHHGAHDGSAPSLGRPTFVAIDHVVVESPITSDWTTLGRWWDRRRWCGFERLWLGSISGWEVGDGARIPLTRGLPGAGRWGSGMAGTARGDRVCQSALGRPMVIPCSVRFQT